MYTNNELVNAYFSDWLNDHQGNHGWALDEIYNLPLQDPIKFWEITLLMVAAAPSEAALEYVASGPLEELLREHGVLLFDNIADEARKNKRFLYALSKVWLDEEEDTFYPALELFKKEHNVDTVNPLTALPWNEGTRPN
jgi:hypothetical protein